MIFLTHTKKCFICLVHSSLNTTCLEFISFTVYFAMFFFKIPFLYFHMNFRISFNFSFLRFILFLTMCICLYFCLLVCACELGAYRGYKMVLDTLDLGLRVVMSHLV